HYFRTHPPGRTTVEICRAEACQAVGGEALAEHAKRSLGVDFHGTTPDGAVSLEAVYCLGNCACGPCVRVGGQLHGRVTPERLDALTARTGDGQGRGRAGVWVSGDARGLAVGADEVAAALIAQGGAGLEVTRIGTRGLLWLEPLVEVDTPAGRVGYGPVAASDVRELLAAGLL